MTEDDPAGRIAARVVAALPRRARIRAIACQLLGGLLAAAVGATLMTPLAPLLVRGDGSATLDAVVLLVTPIVTAMFALAERGSRHRPS